MTDHDPRAADVLAHAPLLYGWDRYRTLGPRRADELLDALAAAGLVVRPADEYEHARNHKYPYEGAYMAGTFCGWVDDEGDEHGRCADGFYRPLYVRKENPDD